MLLMVKKGITGGVSMISNRYGKASNNYMSESVMYLPSYSLLCTCVYLFLVSPVAIFRTGFSLVEYCSGSFRPFLQFDY